MGNRGFYGFSYKSGGGATASGEFEELLLPGQVIWFDANHTPYSDGGAASQISDRVGAFNWFSGNLDQTDARLRKPDDTGRTSIEVATYTFGQATVVLTNPCSVLYVARMKAGGQKKRVLCSTSVNWLMGYWNGNMNSYYANGFVNQGSAADDNIHVWACRQTGSLSTLWRDGTIVASNGNGLQAPGQLQVGGTGANGGATEWSNFYFYELVAYNRAIADYEMDAKIANLKAKWNIT